MKAILDTHVLLWWLESGARISRGHRRVIDQAGPEDPLYISEITSPQR